MSLLRVIAPDIWVVDTPHRFVGLHLGTRMTVVRLSSGALVLHSPIPLSQDLRDELKSLGPVGHIICPNLFHHVYAAEAQAAFPDAMLHGPAKLHRKRKDLRFDAVLSEVPHKDWDGELIPLTIQGCLLNETLFYHPATKTLISCDLVENFHHSSHWFTRWYLSLGGVLGRAGWHPILRLVYFNRRRARESVERLLQWPFERVVLSHGENIQENGRETVREGLAWLL
jgi:uncharacterized protein DUF4336